MFPTIEACWSWGVGRGGVGEIEHWVDTGEGIGFGTIYA